MGIPFSIAVLGAGLSASDEYRIDPTRTTVDFNVRFLRINQARGTFDDVTGRVVYDAQDAAPSALQITVNTSSLKTGDPELDELYKGPYFLDARRHRLITFTSRSITADEDGYVVTGDLTMRGVTQQFVFPLKIVGPWWYGAGPARLRIEADFRVARPELSKLLENVMPGVRVLFGTDLLIVLTARAIREDG